MNSIPRIFRALARRVLGTAGIHPWVSSYPPPWPEISASDYEPIDPDKPELFFFKHLRGDMRIADLGSGPKGAFWWGRLPEGCRVDAFDLYNIPETTPGNVTVHQEDVARLHKRKDFKESFDLVVADHIFEHVNHPPALAKSARHLLKPGGLLHVGIPDATNFTDRFYRLIHPDGGGHISQFSRKTFLDLAHEWGFSLTEERPWPDDWKWFQELYSLDSYGVSHLREEEKKWLAEVLRKEMTLEKGYWYGWEFLFFKS